MSYSLFAPKGLHQYVGGKPAAQALHETALALFARHPAYQGGLSTEEGTLVDLFSFMLAIVVARAARTLERADNEHFADGAYYLLHESEDEYGVTPTAGTTLGRRRAALADAKLLPRGNSRAETEQQLRDLLGADYVGLHVASGDEVAIWPAALGDQPQLLLDADVPRKLVRIVTGISTSIGASQEVAYTPIDPLDAAGGHTLAVGDKLVVEPEIIGRAEVVTVEAISATGTSFTATFDQAHEPNAWATQMPFPMWGSSKRHVLIALTEAAAFNPDARRRAHVKLAKIMTGITTWSLCAAAGMDAIGPWTLDDPVLGALGANPMAIVSIP